jgi:hypothetical protein
MKTRSSSSLFAFFPIFIMALAMVLFTMPAVAQNVFWQEGQKLGVPSTMATTGTLSLVTTDQEKTYQIEGFNRVMKLKLLRLSGEREWKLPIIEKTSSKNIFEGEDARLVVNAISSETVILEYQVKNGVDGLAFLTVESDTFNTTATLAAGSGDLGFEDEGGGFYIQTVGGKALRKRTSRGYRIIIPMDKQKVVRIAISTNKLPLEDIESAILSAIIPKRPEGLATRSKEQQDAGVLVALR